MSSSIEFIGKSGERYRFQVLPIGTTFKAVAAVYVVTKRTFDDRTFATRASHQPLAIGETVNLAATFLGKSELKTLAAKGANYICVCAVADQERRSRIERDLIEGNEVAGGSLRYLFDLVYPADRSEPPAVRDDAQPSGGKT
ncbi:MAG: hypothetical protein JWO70_4474 [Betaproteobacteria bacterium]|jgi:hypothetical protein|nr:hypothetical protein [Betaproteobacteria bacterium]